MSTSERIVHESHIMSSSSSPIRNQMNSPQAQSSVSNPIAGHSLGELEPESDDDEDTGSLVLSKRKLFLMCFVLNLFSDK